MSHVSACTDRIHCRLTEREVTVSVELVSPPDGGPPMERHNSCLSKASSCPRSCRYMGGNVNPRTG